ncbi:hypothetical protein [Sinorhizobium fredii]|uniref:hypothetical protein n=1 Tax=Rhizobium fredii TaxID=380 RepID=UPI0004BAD4CD|nr:hypothetical protein [Sinorhizobium fredii]
MKTYLLVAVTCLLAAPALAETELAHPMPTRQAFKLDAETGCFRYTGKAAEFVGRFKRGSYVSVTMDNPERIPIMDAPEFKTRDPASWFGPIPESRDYSIGYMPAMLFGTPGTVTICGRTFPPGSAEEAAHVDKVVQDMLDNDPNSQDVLNEPRVHAEATNDDGEQADVCGFPVRDVSIQAGEGADASTLQPLMAGSVRHYANLFESPFDVFATCTPAKAEQSPKTVKLPRNTKDCYFAGGKLECSNLTEGEIVPAE